jgi:DNA-binding NtrC family response regulator
MNNVPVTYHEAVACFKREFLRQMLAAHGGNRSRTARALGLQRTYLLRLLRSFDLQDGRPQARPK